MACTANVEGNASVSIRQSSTMCISSLDDLESDPKVEEIYQERFANLSDDYGSSYEEYLANYENYLEAYDQFLEEIRALLCPEAQALFDEEIANADAEDQNEFNTSSSDYAIEYDFQLNDGF